MMNLHFLILLSFLVSFGALAQGSSGGTTNCTPAGMMPVSGASCCPGLVHSANTNTCEDKSIQDKNLVSCMTHTDCSPSVTGVSGYGCYPMDEDNLFEKNPTSEAEMDELDDAEDALDEEQVLRAEDPKPVGASCNISSECESYSCVKNKCVEKLVCRFAEQGEVAPGFIQCEEGLFKNGNNECDIPAVDKFPTFAGLLNGDVKIKQEANACRFELDDLDAQTTKDEVKDRAMTAMKTMRGMEWLFLTSTFPEQEECFQLLPFLKHEVARKFYERRKLILNNFNKVFAEIEKDYETLKNAKLDGTATLTIHGGQVLESTLANRRTSGWDTLKLMWRRNLMLQQYEKAMQDLVQETSAKLKVISEEMGSWKDKDKKWTVNGKEYTSSQLKCRGGKKKVRARWSYRYRVNGKAQKNADTLKRPQIAAFLDIINQKKNHETANTLANLGGLKKFYLLDPLMPGNNLSFGSFGSGKKRKRNLTGAQNANFADMWKQYHERMKNHYKGLKADASLINFVYEPEIIGLEARNCADTPTAKGCEGWASFMEELTDISFAQFLAYSTHRKKKYKKYFPSASTMRRRLFEHYETDFHNINNYYTSILKAREDQNACIEAALNGIHDDFFSQTPSGLTPEAGSSANPNPNNYSGGTAGNTLTSETPGKITPLERLKYTFDLASPELKNLSTSTQSSNVQPGANVGGAASSAFGGPNFQAMSKRLSEMKTAAVKASSAGVNVKAREKNIAASMKSLNRSTASKGMSGTSPQTPSLSHSSEALSSLGKTLPADSQPADLGGRITNAPLQEKPNIHAATPDFSRVEPVGGIAGEASVAESDPTGLSEEDKAVIEANYQRTKSEYKADETDDLFSKLSKAYVRNLDKILKRRKAE